MAIGFAVPSAQYAIPFGRARGIGRCFPTLDIAGEFDGLDSISVAISAGLGVALLAEGSSVDADLSLVPLAKESAAPVPVSIGWRNDSAPDPITNNFIQELVQTCKPS